MELTRRQIVVPVGPDLAFSVFVDEIGAWWPVGEAPGVFGAAGVVSLKDGAVVEVGPDGDEARWGTVLDWDPPRRLRLSWHPAEPPAAASEVEVSFAEVIEGQTLVTLEHRGGEFAAGWPSVLDRYADLASQNMLETDEGEVWLALLHAPGPVIGDRVSAHPDFAEHLAFLRSLRDEGLLVAAGPLDGPGEGMTVVRLADASGVPEMVRRAQDDDLSVARGVLRVRIRPWHVALTGA